MKPIFKQEKEYLERVLGIELPENCWRSSSKIYLNVDSEKPLVKFKAEQGNIEVKKNNIVSINEDGTVTFLTGAKTKKAPKQATEKNLTFEEEYALRKDYLKELIEESITTTIKYIQDDKNKDKKHRISISGGKDSDVTLWIMKQVYERMGLEMREHCIPDSFNTTNDTGDTYKHIKKTLMYWYPDAKNIRDARLIDHIHSPAKGWYQWLKEDKNWFLPSIRVRNCCSTYKEGRAKDVFDGLEPFISFMGMRKYESNKRAEYDWDLNESIIKKYGKSKLNCPKNQDRFLPIVNWKDEDVWLVILHEKIEFNRMYLLGYSRCGCLLCPFATEYTDMLTREHYPQLMDRWNYALEQNYIATKVDENLKWTLDEWKKGKWKKAISFEGELISLTPTKERVQKLAERKGISEEMAMKYFKRTCKECESKLNPDEIGMNYKLYGRFEGMEDNRELYCKSCLCERENWTPKQYQQMLWSFREQKCNLF